MNERHIILINYLNDGEKHNIGQITSFMNMSYANVKNYIEEINYFLKTINIGKINEKDNSLYLNINTNEVNLINSRIINLDNYSLSSRERINLVKYFLLIENGPVIIQELAEKFKCSKSSLDKDISIIKERFGNLGIRLQIGKNRKGYNVISDNLRINNELYKLVMREIDLNQMTDDKVVNNYFQQFVFNDLISNNLEKTVCFIEAVEKKENLKFSYLSFQELIIHICILIKKTKANPLKKHKDAFTDLYREIFGVNLNEQQEKYLLNLINGASSIAMREYMNNDWANVQLITSSLVAEVSDRLHINLSDDNELVDNLSLHIGSMIYRQVNLMPSVNPSLDVVKNKYSNIIDVIRKAIIKINNEDLNRFDIDSIAFTTIHFCAALERRKNRKENFKCLIVCVYGYSTATLIKEMITSKYRNISIEKVITSEGMNKTDLKGIDFVVSSVDIKDCSVPVIVVKPIFDEFDYKKIDEMIKLLNMENRNFDALTLNDLLSANDNDEKEVIMEPNSSLRMIDLICDKGIQFIEECKDYRTAIELAGKPLIDCKNVADQYIKDIIDTFETNGLYMIISKNVALIHGPINKGVNKTSISLLGIKKGVSFGHKEFDPVKLIMCLATKDNYTHVKALNDFIEVVNELDFNNSFSKEYITDIVEEVCRK